MDEEPLVFVPDRHGQPRVVGTRTDPPRHQALGDLFHGLSGGAVDDARVALDPLEEGHHLLEGPVFLGDAKGEVGPIEAGHEATFVREPQAVGDVVAHPWGRRGGQRQAHGLREPSPHIDDLAILGPEVVAPLRDAVGFVDGQTGDGQTIEQRQRAILEQGLGRQVQQLGGAAAHQLLVVPVGAAVQGAVQHHRIDPQGPQLLHLILHQRDQRRDHHREPIEQQRRELVAEGLPTTGRHHGEGVPEREHALDHLRLQRPERVEAEDLAHQLGGCAGGDTRTAMLPWRRGEQVVGVGW